MIDLVQEEIKLVPHTPLEVCDYSKGDTEDQHHHATQLLAVPDAELGMYMEPNNSVQLYLLTTSDAHW